MAAAFRTGDVVRHRPSGEKWIVAFADEFDLIPCGWPESVARPEDCELIEACSDDEHRILLDQIVNGRGSSLMRSRCFFLLEAMRETECAAMMHL